MQIGHYILDSGAFTEYKKGKVISIEKYAEFVLENKALFEFCFNLDVIGDGKKSYQNWVWLRKNGVDTIPIYHIGTDLKYLEKYIKQSEYIGLGAIANLNSAKRIPSLKFIWENYLLDGNNQAKIKVHGLGLTAIDILERFPWYSTDSISPVIQAIWGGCLLPTFRGSVPNYSKLKGFVISDKRKHQTKTTTSFFTLPLGLQQRYIKEFTARGFCVTRLENLNNDGLFSDSCIKEGVTGHGNSLNEDFTARILWNLQVWYQYLQTLPKYQSAFGEYQTKVYVCSAADTALKWIVDSGCPHHTLVSYAYFYKNQHLQYLKSLKK